MTYLWQRWPPQSLSPKPFSPLGKRPTPPAIIARKRAIWSKTVRNWKRRTRKMPNNAKLLGRKHTPNVGPVARLITRRNDVSKVPARISNLSAPDPRTHLIVILTQKHQNPTITQHRPIPSLPPTKTNKKLASPRLQYNQLVSVRQYNRWDPPTKTFHDYQN